jgi:hypothetical protein
MSTKKRVGRFVEMTAYAYPPVKVRRLLDESSITQAILFEALGFRAPQRL